MATAATASETVEYRVVLIDPATRAVLASGSTGGYRLPRARIPQWARPAHQLQKVIEAEWGLDALILDIEVGSTCSTPWIVAELLSTPGKSRDFREVGIDQIMDTELLENERAEIELLLADKSNRPLCRIGWIDEAISWIESVTGRRVSTRKEIEQLNAGGGYALLRFRLEDGSDIWLKATGEPNVHELTITSFLSKLCGRYLPKFIASRLDWNAWLTSGDSDGITELPTEPQALLSLLGDAVSSMAELQIETVGRKLDLLKAGAFDQGLDELAASSEEVFQYLKEAMSRQTSNKATRLERSRMEEIRAIFEDVCERMDALGLPSSVLHGDLNPANIVVAPDHCRFIDWCETYVGNPLIALQHLLLLNQVDPPEIRTLIDQVLTDRYRTVMSRVCEPSVIDAGLIYMPLLAAFSALFGRGDWLATPLRDNPCRQARARTLARHMDRTARDPILLESLRVSSIG